MQHPKILFYFAYNSPYSFLANTRIERVLARFTPEIEYRPVYSPRSAGAPAPAPERLRYMFEDVQRFADEYGVKLAPGPLADTRKACLSFFFAGEQGRGKPFHDAVYSCRFLEGGDIGQEATLAEIGRRVGLDPDALVACLQEDRYADALDASNREAESDGVFGFPFFIYEGQRFWGNDRIEWLERAISQRAD